MSDLSFIAQAVLDAGQKYATQAWSDATHQRFNLGIAAALRAAVNQVVPDLPKPTHEGTRQSDSDIDYWEDCQQHRANLLVIADELEGVKYGTYRCNLKGK